MQTRVSFLFLFIFVSVSFFSFERWRISPGSGMDNWPRMRDGELAPTEISRIRSLQDLQVPGMSVSE